MMMNFIFSLGKYMKKATVTALIFGLLISPSLALNSTFSSGSSQSLSTIVQALTEGSWLDVADTSWYDNENATAFTISTAEDLVGLVYLVDAGTDFSGKTITITNDIDLGEYDWVPIGTEENPFKGTFDGNCHKIKNLTIGDEDEYAEYMYAGLFGYIKNADIYNVSIDGGYIYNKSSEVGTSTGAICGYANNSSIYACTSNIDVITGDWSTTGGICGFFMNSLDAKKISQCINNGAVSSGYRTGGICGSNSSKSALEYCINTGSVNGGDLVGGICAWNYRGTIENCVNNGDVSSEKESAGGICAYVQNTKISKCANTGKVSIKGGSGNKVYVGGICARIYTYDNGENRDIEIVNCNNSGEVQVSGTFGKTCYAGGILGCLWDNGRVKVTISYCCNRGSVSSDPTSIDTYSGSIAGYILKGTIKNCAQLSKYIDAFGKNHAGMICGYAGNGSVTISETYYEIGAVEMAAVGNTDFEDTSGIIGLTENQIKSESGTTDDSWVNINNLGKVSLIDILNNGQDEYVWRTHSITSYPILNNLSYRHLKLSGSIANKYYLGAETLARDYWVPEEGYEDEYAYTDFDGRMTDIFSLEDPDGTGNSDNFVIRMALDGNKLADGEIEAGNAILTFENGRFICSRPADATNTLTKTSEGKYLYIDVDGNLITSFYGVAPEEGVSSAADLIYYKEDGSKADGEIEAGNTTITFENGKIITIRGSSLRNTLTKTSEGKYLYVDGNGTLITSFYGISSYTTPTLEKIIFYKEDGSKADGEIEAGNATITFENGTMKARILNS